MNDQIPVKGRPRRHVLRNTAFTVLSRAQGALFAYLIIRLLLDVLSVEQYGLHSLLFIGVLLYLPPLFQLGMPNVMNRFIPEYFAASRFGLIHNLFKVILRLQFISTVLTALGAIILADQIAVWINYPDSALVIRIFALGAITFTISSLFQELLEGTFRQHTSFWVNLAINIIRLSSLFVVTRFYPTFFAVIIVEVIVMTVRLGMYLIIYYRDMSALSHPDSADDDTPPWKTIRKYGGLSYLNEVGVSLLSVATDMLLVTSISGALATGYYALASRITSLTAQILPEQSLSPVVRPLFFSEYGSESSQQSSGFGFAMLMKGSLLISLLFSIWLALMAEPVIVYLFDPEYAEAGSLLAIMAVFIAAGSLRFPLVIMLQNAQRIDLLIYVKVTAFIKIGLGLWLVPKYGAIAMVWIAGATLLAQDLALYYFIVSRLGHRGDPVGMAKIILNGLITAGIFFFLCPYFNSLIGVILSPFVFFLIYVGINLLNKSFRQEERTFINNHLPRRLWYF